MVRMELMPKTIQELIAWLEANPELRIGGLDDETWECINNWRNAVADNTVSSVELANPKELLQFIKAAREIMGDDILEDIERSFKDY